eukprot:GHVS01103889.1.p1 GENE.GHVS01103889.1~~GHVS01103889.1.p1  ORF type:complete len:123 (+),score=11.85 GHVS01103889.1:28-369(+)
MVSSYVTLNHDYNTTKRDVVRVHFTTTCWNRTVRFIAFADCSRQERKCKGFCYLGKGKKIVDELVQPKVSFRVASTYCSDVKYTVTFTSPVKYTASWDAVGTNRPTMKLLCFT